MNNSKLIPDYRMKENWRPSLSNLNPMEFIRNNI